ncbi:MAG: insulinase family protein [Oscillospiraceae bacterium]|nr:insulinase family protein [Oscillospiraceae bacterium]
MCELLSECLLNPNAENGAFDENTTDLMRAELIDTIDSVINEKSSYAIQNANKTAFVGEPMEFPANGTHEQAEKVTAKSAYTAYRRILESARVEIFAVGCSDFSDAERILSETFKKIERKNICELTVTPSKLKPEPAFASDRLPMQQAILRMYFKAPELTDRFAGTMFTMILGGMTTSRFFENIREKQSLCYYCSCVAGRNKRYLAVYAGVEPKNIERTREAVLEEIRDICENGVSDEEIKTAMLEINNEISSIYDSGASMTGWYLNQLTDGKTLSPEEFCEEIRAVTAERIQAAARLYSLDTVYTLSGEEQ